MTTWASASFAAISSSPTFWNPYFSTLPGSLLYRAPPISSMNPMLSWYSSVIVTSWFSTNMLTLCDSRRSPRLDRSPSYWRSLSLTSTATFLPSCLAMSRLLEHHVPVALADHLRVPPLRDELLVDQARRRLPGGEPLRHVAHLAARHLPVRLRRSALRHVEQLLEARVLREEDALAREEDLHLLARLPC